MRFAWDPKKAAANCKKHGITFLEACTAFDDPHGLRAADEKHSTEHETREWLIGESDLGLLVVVYTLRNAGRIYRIISARKANRKERLLYFFHLGLRNPSGKSMACLDGMPGAAHACASAVNACNQAKEGLITGQTTAHRKLKSASRDAY